MFGLSEIVAYTDGSCYPNPGGLGGWAFVVEFNGKLLQAFGCAQSTTNNEMELTAIREALLGVRITSHPMVLTTDSQYALRALTLWADLWEKHGWTNSIGQPVKNRELIEHCRALIKQHRAARELRLNYTRGHVGTPLNELADTLAGRARKEQTSGREITELKHKSGASELTPP